MKFKNTRFNRIYISGKVSGTDDYIERFAKAEASLKRLFPEAEVFNPVKEIIVSGTDLNDWKSCMVFCLAHENFCDAIYLMDGWKDSNGAQKEYEFAKNHGFKILEEVQGNEI